MAIEAVKNLARVVLIEMRENQVDEAADDLSALICDLDGPERREAALRQLTKFCHPRAFGDFYIPAMSWEDWLAHLAMLKRACLVELQRARLSVVEGSGSPDYDPPAVPPAPLRSESGARRKQHIVLIDSFIVFLITGLFFSGVMIASQLPMRSPPETVRVFGEFSRSQPNLARHYAFNFGSGRGRFTLKGDSLTYEILGPPRFSWSDLSPAINKGDHLTLFVQKKPYVLARARLDAIKREAERNRVSAAISRLAPRLLSESARNPVPVLEIRRGGRVIFSRLRILPDRRRAFVAWSSLAILMFTALVSIIAYDRRTTGGAS